MTCHVSPLRTAGLLLLALLMTGVSWFAATHAGDYRAYVGWLGVALFGLATIMIARQLSNREPVVTIDSQGIRSMRLGTDMLSWSDIDSASIGKVQSTRFLCLWLKDEDRYLQSLSAPKAMLARSNRALGFPAVTISFQGLVPGLDAAIAEVAKHVPLRS